MESVSTILTTARQYNKLERYYMTSRVKIKGGWGWTHPGRQRTPTANTGQKVWGRVSTPPLDLAPVHAVRNQHNYTASESEMRIKQT